MYGKVFESIYDGTLHGHWQAIVTMQQLIVLANQDGVVDITPQSISSRTSIPLDIIEKGLEHLAKPDPHSRTPGDDGRRIVLLDDHRPWGWRLVNHAKYRALRDQEQKREADRTRIAEKRVAEKLNKNSSVAIGSQSVAKVAHTDTYADADTEAGKTSAPSASRVAASGKNGHDVLDPIVERIPLCDGSEYGVPKSMRDELDKLYPAVDPDQTLREIRGWNLANPKKRKTPRGIKAHIFDWFKREQDSQSRRSS